MMTGEQTKQTKKNEMKPKMLKFLRWVFLLYELYEWQKKSRYEFNYRDNYRLNISSVLVVIFLIHFSIKRKKYFKPVQKSYLSTLRMYDVYELEIHYWYSEIKVLTSFSNKNTVKHLIIVYCFIQTRSVLISCKFNKDIFHSSNSMKH